MECGINEVMFLLLSEWLLVFGEGDELWGILFVWDLVVEVLECLFVRLEINVFNFDISDNGRWLVMSWCDDLEIDLVEFFKLVVDY